MVYLISPQSYTFSNLLTFLGTSSRSVCSIMFSSMTGFFYKAEELIHEMQQSAQTFLIAENSPGEHENSTEHAETLSIAFRQFLQTKRPQ